MSKDLSEKLVVELCMRGLCEVPGMGDMCDGLCKGLSWSWQITKRRRPPNDPFFEDGDLVCSLASKQLPLEEQEALFSYGGPEFVCSIARCSKSFDNLSSYEAHYNSTHRNVCGTCGRCFPSNHLLELHILETHDSMFEILATKQNMFQCLVEGCVMKFAAPAPRKDHLVRVHHYPPNFRFHRGKKSRTKPERKDCSVNTDRQIEDMESDPVPPSDTRPTREDRAMAVSGVQKQETQQRRVFSYNVPHSVMFGQGVSRGFYRRGRGGHRGPRGKKAGHWHQKAGGTMELDTTVDIETVKMDDLASALTT